LKTNQKGAYTFIEMVGVIAAIAALAAALVVPAIRHLQELARQKEADTLRSFGDAYRQQVKQAKIIPSEITWASAVASQLGLQTNKIVKNEQNLGRVFLIDPNLKIGNNSSFSLSYTQQVAGHMVTNASGISQRPFSPKVMLISSTSLALPGGLVSGVGASSGVLAFDNIWNTADGTVPAGWVWGGRGIDLKIQRIHLADLFIQVVLNNRDGVNVPSYSVDSSGAATVPYGGLLGKYFLKGTEIKLFNAGGGLEYSELLADNRSFTFEYGTWMPEAFLAPTSGDITPHDLDRAMYLFMSSALNPGTKAGATQTTVSNAMVVFINEFISWQAGGFGKTPKALTKAQADLTTVTGNLITP
jgi:hypothetical protein